MKKFKLISALSAALITASMATPVFAATNNIEQPVAPGFGPVGSVMPGVTTPAELDTPAAEGLGPDASMIPQLYSEVQLFVQNIYKVALDRSADIEGLNFWENALTSEEWSGRQVLFNLLNTPEYRGLDLSAQEFVKGMYTIINGRTPDEDGYNFWVQEYKKAVQYKDQADARIEVLDRMMNESEFKTRCASMGIRF